MSKLAASVTQGKVYGLDYSEAAVAVATRTNRQWIAMDRVEIRQGSVSHLPFVDETFDVVTAVETHFWWRELSQRFGAHESTIARWQYDDVTTTQGKVWPRSTFRCRA